MSQIIGFAGNFYTLWNYERKENWSTNSRGEHYLSNITHNYYYIKNISIDLEKVKRLHPDLGIDENLRGKTQSWERNEKIELPYNLFPFGKLMGEDIATCNDIWQLERTYSNDNNPRRKAVARRRLIELGELVRFDWIDYKFVSASDYNDFKGIPAIEYYNNAVAEFKAKGFKVNQSLYEKIAIEGSETTVFEIPRKYCTKKQYAYFLAKQQKDAENAASVFLHTDGEKVTLDIKEIESYGYDSQFGYVFIKKYVSKDGAVYTYKGSSPTYIEDKDNFIKVKATIKHNEYNGAKQTLLQRIKVI